MGNIRHTLFENLIQLSKQGFNSKMLLSQSEIGDLICESRKQQVYGLVGRNILKLYPDLKELEYDLLLESVAYVYKEREIKELAGIFSEAGIQYVIIKGVSYGYQVYKVKESRGFNDVDILIDSSDARKAHETLLNIGGEVTEDTLSCKSVDERLEYQSHLNTYKWKNLIIELHQTDNNHVDIVEIVKKRHNVNNIYITDLLDTFIIACNHLWHHFPYSTSSLKFNNQLSLRLFVDVYESYKVVKAAGIEDSKIMERAASVNAGEILSAAVSMVEEIFGLFFEDREILDRGVFDYPKHYGEHSISMFDRLFSPTKAYEMVLGLYNKRPGEIITISQENKGNIDVSKRLHESVLYGPLYFTTIPCHEDFKCLLNMQWNQQSLTFNIEIQSENAFNFSETESYQMNFNHIEVSVITDAGPKTVYIEAKKNLNTFLYTRDNKEENPVLVQQNGSIQIINDEAVRYSFEIPWKVLSIEPTQNKEFKTEITYIENQYSIGKKYIYALFGGECSSQSTSDFWPTLKFIS